MANSKPLPAAYTERQSVFQTDRLFAVVGEVTDTDFFYCLWTNPRVMVNVGFPRGLPVTKAEISAILQEQQGQILDARLLVVLRSSGQAIGECKLGAVDDDGVSRTDVKLLPEFWGHKYGVEVKKGLLDYLFRFTNCMVVEATPNINNIASIRMQEAVGGVRVGRQTFQVSEAMRDFAQPVVSHVYHVHRKIWLSSET